MSLLIKSVKSWWQEVQLFFTSSYDPDLVMIQIPPSWGEGTIHFHHFGNDLSLLDVNIKLSKRFNLVRLGKAEEVNLFVMAFFLTETDIKHIPDDQESKLIDNNTGIHLSSADIPLKITIPANKEIRVLQSNFTAESLKTFMPAFSFPDELYRILNEEKSFLFYEPITWNIKSQLINFKEHFILPAYEVNWLKLKTLELLMLGISKIGKRFYQVSSYKVFSEDLHQIIQLKQNLESSWEQIPVIDDLAEEMNFSRSKLQRLFKQVMGTSIAQFAKTVRLNKAFELLSTGKFTVSDVALKVGYNSLGHFTNAFKSHHHTLPGELINKEVNANDLKIKI